MILFYLLIHKDFIKNYMLFVECIESFKIRCRASVFLYQCRMCCSEKSLE